MTWINFGTKLSKKSENGTLRAMLFQKDLKQGKCLMY